MHEKRNTQQIQEGGGSEGLPQSHFPTIGTITPSHNRAARRRAEGRGGGGGGVTQELGPIKQGEDTEGSIPVAQGGADGDSPQDWGSRIVGEEWDADAEARGKAAAPASRNKHTWHLLHYAQVAPMKQRAVSEGHTATAVATSTVVLDDTGKVSAKEPRIAAKKPCSICKRAHKYPQKNPIKSAKKAYNLRKTSLFISAKEH